MSAIICFYHANCVDGAASAAVIKKKYPEAVCYPMTHGDSIPTSVEGKTVFIVDFSFSEETLIDFKKKAEAVHWYDHHKTSIPTQQALQWGIIDLAESGATLSWKQEYPGLEVPRILQYVKDKDIWEWKLPHSREINMALREHQEIHHPESQLWRELIDQFDDKRFQQMVEVGKIAIQSQRLRMVSGAKHGFEIDFHGHRTWAVNWSLESSEMGEYIYKEMGYEIALIFYYAQKQWNFSLRSSRVDVSQLALQYGGGGHPGAAGFRKDSVEWLMRLQKK